MEVSFQGTENARRAAERHASKLGGKGKKEGLIRDDEPQKEQTVR
jgi:hypothetical protein